MKISQEELEIIKNKASQCDLKIIDGYVMLKDNTPVDVLNYIINKYPDVSDIHFGTTPRETYRTGSLYIYGTKDRYTDGFITSHNQDVVISIDGLNFKHDEINKHILEMDDFSNPAIDKTFSFNSTSDFFEPYQFRVAISSTTLSCRRFKNIKPPTFSLNEIKTTENIEPERNRKSFNFDEHLDLTGDERLYSSIKNVNNEQIDKLKLLYQDKIDSIASKYKLTENGKINTIVDLKTGEFKFYKRIAFHQYQHCEILYYILNNFEDLNNTLYKSIIEDVEKYTSQMLGYDVKFNDKIIVKSYIDLISMTAI